MCVVVIILYLIGFVLMRVDVFVDVVLCRFVVCCCVVFVFLFLI